MMKKLLSLILVLGIVPFANAGLKWMVNGEVVDMNGALTIERGPVSVALYNDTEAYSVVGNTFLTATIAGTSAHNPVGGFYGANLPGTWEFVPDYSGDFGDGYYWWYFNMKSPAVATFKAGKLFEISFNFDGPLAVVDRWDERAKESLGSLTLMVPEPASMLLLGLGGLFLRRK